MPMVLLAVASPRLLAASKASVPPLTLTAPEKVFGPLKVCVPVPVFVTPKVPAVFLMMPEKFAVASLSPTVSVGVPLVPSTVPLPLRPLMVSLKPARLSVPMPVPFELMMTVPVPVPFGIWLVAPRFRVALLPVAALRLMTVSP